MNSSQFHAHYLKKFSQSGGWSIGTLGPAGTRSEETARQLAVRWKKEYNSLPRISLYSSFEEVQSALISHQINVALVPNAYERVNEYYINPDIVWVDHFPHDTPTYGLAMRKGAEIPRNQCRIVTHPAPRLLVKHLLSKLPHPPRHYSINLVQSTSVAAKWVKEKAADLAITNAITAAREGLVFIEDYGKIKMSWSLFCKKAFIEPQVEPQGN